MLYRRTTLGTDKRIWFAVKEPPEWLKTAERCVAETVRPGCLFVTSLALWAKQNSLTAQEANAAIEAYVGMEGSPAEIPRVSLCAIKRKKQQGNTGYRLSLDHLGTWNLLEHDNRPSELEFPRRQVDVLVRVMENGMYVWAYRSTGREEPTAPSFFWD